MHKKIIYFIVGTAAIVLGIVYFIGNNRSGEDLGYSFETGLTHGSTLSGTDSIFYCVYICGSVMNPGVYELEAGSRIYDVINLAGGVLEDADIDVINQAEKISDGQKIYVPRYGENSREDDNTGGLVNINTADIAGLTTLPGIGEARAKDIISYRESAGKFARIEDIMNVTGIKEAAFNKIKEYICV